MINISQIKKNEAQSKSAQQIWKQLLNTSQIYSKDTSKFPQVRACQLRLTYSKLQSHKNYSLQSKLAQFHNTRASFLLQKQEKSKKNADRVNFEKTKIFNFNNKKEQDMNKSFNANTIDVVSTNRMSQIRKKSINDILKVSQLRKSQQFSQYFKKVILNQKASIDIGKICSEGKCVSMTDRAHFERLQRVKWSIMNRKLQQKSFNCASKKINNFHLQNPIIWQLPDLNLSKKKKQKQAQKKKQKAKRLSKLRYQNQPKQLNQNYSSFICDPWQSNPTFNDQQYQ